MFIGAWMETSRRLQAPLRVRRVAAANHRIPPPGRCGIRSIRGPGIRESSRAQAGKGWNCGRAAEIRANPPPRPSIHPSPSRYFHGVIDVVPPDILCLFVGGGGGGFVSFRSTFRSTRTIECNRYPGFYKSVKGVEYLFVTTNCLVKFVKFCLPVPPVTTEEFSSSFRIRRMTDGV